MKKNILPIFVLLFGISQAQIGINTPNPNSTLDVTAKNATGTTTNTDGFLTPRVDRQRAQSMSGIPTSTLIYVNSIATGTPTGTAINIDATGFYYYNGTAWVKLHNPNNSTNTNIYNADGSLTGNRTVTQGANRLAFNSTAVNGFSVDGSTFSVDGANDRIGIGTTSPSAKLHLEGSQYINAAVAAASTKNALDINVGQDAFSYGNRTDNFGINMRTSSTAGPGNISRINFGDTSTTTTTGNRYLSFSVGQTPNELIYLTDANSGRVGIGTVNPQTKLHVDGGESRFSIGASAWGLAPSSGGTTGASNSLEIIDRVNNIRRMILSDNGDVSLGGSIGSNSSAGTLSIRTNKVGIGTGSPARNLEVAAGNAPIRFSNLETATSSTNVLAIDASGDVRSIPFNNLNSGTFALLNVPGANYNASGNENMIWVSTNSVTVTLPPPTDNQLGKMITIVASGGGSVTLSGEAPIVSNGATLTSIPQTKRITVYAIPTNIFTNIPRTWLVAQKDF